MRQFRLLFANAWLRFTRADGLARGADPRSVYVLAALALGAPGMIQAFLLLTAPIFFNGKLAMIVGPSLNLLAYFSGLVVALLTLLQWEALLPSPADVAMLAPLPVAPRLLVAAQGAALVALLALLTAIVNVPAVILVPLLDAPTQAQAGTVMGTALLQAAGVTVTACLAFGVLLGAQSLLQVCLGRRGVQTIRGVVQLAGLVAVLVALLLLPVALVSRSLPGWLFASPLPWAKSVAEVMFAAGALYVLAAGRALRLAAPHSRHRRGLPHKIWRCSHSPCMAAISRFAALTLLRCRRQRFIVGLWIAAGIAVAIVDWTGAAFAVPLVLAPFILLGLRRSFAVPADLRSNWVFRVALDESPGDWCEGARHLMALCLAVLVAAAALFLFRAPRALGQLALLALAGAVGIQILTWNLCKIPFTCSYRPGDIKLKYVWPFYVLAFTLGGWALVHADLWLLHDRVWIATALVILAVALVGSERLRRGRNVLLPLFEDEPEPVVQTLFSNY